MNGYPTIIPSVKNDNSIKLRKSIDKTTWKVLKQWFLNLSKKTERRSTIILPGKWASREIELWFCIASA